MLKQLLLSVLVSFGMATEWGTSASVRTPNDDIHPLDYEFSIKLEDTNGKFQYLLKRDWERELGEKYIDDVVNFQHEVIGHMYYGIDYVNKESKDISYTIYNTGFQHPIGLKVGVSVKEDTPLLSAGFSKKLKKDDLEYNIGLSVKSNFEDDNIFNAKSEVKKWFGRFNIFGLYKHEYYNEKEDFQFKVGVGVKL